MKQTSFIGVDLRVERHHRTMMDSQTQVINDTPNTLHVFTYLRLFVEAIS